MNWKKRIREIAARNPDGLHPIIKSAIALNAGDEAWDRVVWQTQPANGAATAAEAARPIVLVLEWLSSKRLLTNRGIEELRKAETGQWESIALTRQMVLSRAARFLDRSYQEWYDEFGTNLVIGGGPSAEAQSNLETRWASGKNRENHAG